MKKLRALDLVSDGAVFGELNEVRTPVETAIRPPTAQSSAEQSLAESGDATGSAGGSDDASAVRQALLQSERAAVAGRLAAALGHEIYNPLTSALSNVDFLRGNIGPEDAEFRTALDEIRTSILRVRNVVRELQLLAFGEPDKRERIDLGRLVQRVVRLVCDESPVPVEVVVDSVVILGVEAPLYQLIHTLLAAFTRGAVAGSQIDLTVQDTGAEAVVTCAGTVLRGALSAMRSDMLGPLRGERLIYEVPLALARRITNDLGGEFGLDGTDSNLTATLRFPRAPAF